MFFSGGVVKRLAKLPNCNQN